MNIVTIVFCLSMDVVCRLTGGGRRQHQTNKGWSYPISQTFSGYFEILGSVGLMCLLFNLVLDPLTLSQSGP